MASAENPAENGRIVLFGAQWCAPCAAELRGLPALVEAASPDRIELAWVDRPPRLPPGQEGVRIWPPQQAQAMAVQIGGQGYGLPFAVRFDRGGRACAVWKAPVRPRVFAGLRRQCGE